MWSCSFFVFCVCAQVFVFSSKLEDTTTTEKPIIESPKNLIVECVNETSFLLSWDEPNQQPDNYKIQISPEKLGPGDKTCLEIENETYSVEGTENNYTYIGARPYFQYTVYVSAAKSKDTSESANGTCTTKKAESKKPTNLKYVFDWIDDTKQSLNISWDMPCEVNDDLKNFTLKYTGRSAVTNVTTEPVEKNIAIVDYTQIHYENVIEEIKPLHFYEIEIWATGDLLGEKATITTNKSDDVVPGPPQNLRVTETTKNSFKLLWDKPEYLPEKYTVYISPSKLGPLGENCTPDSEISKIVDGTNFEFYFNKAQPYFHYIINISARNIKGGSDNASATTTTAKSESGQPRFVETAWLDNEQTLNISWSLPCDPNDELEKFTIEYTGFYVIADTITNDSYSKELDVAIEENRNSYSILIEEIKPSHKYVISIYAKGDLEGLRANITRQSKEKVPSEPTNLGKHNITSSSFEISWTQPKGWPGKINYTYSITPKTLGIHDENCIDSSSRIDETIDDTTFKYSEARPYHEYAVAVFATNLAGSSNPVEIMVETAKQAADQPRDLNVKLNDIDGTRNLTLNWKIPCNVNDDIKHFFISCVGKSLENNISVHEETYNVSIDENKIEYEYLIDDIRPAYQYEIKVWAQGDFEGEKTPSRSISTNYAAPDPISASSIPFDTSDSEPIVTLNINQFKSTNTLTYISLILSNGEVGDCTGSGIWNSSDTEKWLTCTGREITKPRWNPFKDNDIITFKIGIDDCNIADQHCNGPLEKDAVYILIIRAMTIGSYRYSDGINFKIDGSILGAVLGSIFGILIAVAAGAVFVAWKKKIIPIKTSSSRKQTIPHAIQVKQYLTFCKDLTEHPEKVKEQFDLLNKLCKEKDFASPITVAVFPENQRKNRYTNILPYDETRVKLKIDEDDEIGSDYINASYIKGFSGNVEYIATQGPLPHTCRDFWKMIMQEDVTIIVMVSQFIENNKNKCHEYIPKNHEMVEFDDIAIKCTTELHFGNHCVRYIQVKRDLTQRTIIHMQCLDWPDFGVPSGTESMLQFILQMRERTKKEGGRIAVHCSAGVGRTGTLIATDILLQELAKRNSINIFQTVLNLRKQRCSMVQTEKQYFFIHLLLKEWLENPNEVNDNYDDSQLIYENLKDTKQVESKL